MSTTAPQTQRNTLPIILLVALIAAVALVVANFFLLNRNADYQRGWVTQANDIQVLSQQIAKSASEAAIGTLAAFDELTESRAEISESVGILQNGNPETGLPPSPDSVDEELAALDATWTIVNENAQAIEQRSDLVLDLADAADNFASSIPQIQARMDQVVRTLAQNRAPTQQVFIASRQLVLADRMLRRSGEIVRGGVGAVSAADNFSRDAAFFEQVLNALLNGDAALGVTPVRDPQALESLGEVLRLFEEAKPDIEAVIASSSELYEVRQAADEILLDTEDLFDQASALANSLNNLGATGFWPSVPAGLLFAGIALALLILIGFSLMRGQQQRARITADINRKNQEAILRLLDEMASLADGDLTVEATVTEDVTGAIADSVNFAVESMRDLVVGINETAQKVAAQANETRANTNQLADSASHQANEVQGAAKTINEMARAFDQMADQSRESAEVAQKSVSIASDGAATVRETMSGMDTIRDQIQETSKRIKRLGESSQEIGDIVELINGIAEQTNILALNAAIQAASAGGAGRGFAVVADEVQRLAERATNATRRIEGLVQTIQADTGEAVDSMEATTSQVVKGAKLAEDAGAALSQIETVSKDLAGLIQNISGEAQSQSQTATRVAGLMNDIRDTSIQTAEGTSEAAQQVGSLADLVRELRDSVADFRLPEDERQA